MSDISTHHRPELGHHIQQGSAWLAASNNGDNTAALSYAAFELRFAVERIAVHYWAQLLNQKLEADDLLKIESFKVVERRIYELAGHQHKINGHFAFMRIFLGALNVDMPFHTPNIPALSKYWSECSNLCHIAWPLACAVPEVRSDAFAKLTVVRDDLSTHVGSLGWPLLKDPAIVALRDRFIEGHATDKDVLAYIQSTGIWAQAVYPDGRPSHFVGDPVKPDGVV